MFSFIYNMYFDDIQSKTCLVDLPETIHYLKPAEIRTLLEKDSSTDESDFSDPETNSGEDQDHVSEVSDIPDTETASDSEVENV